MKLRAIKNRAYVISQRIAMRNLWKHEVIASVMGALKDVGFVHDTNRETKFVPPISLNKIIYERRLGDTVLNKEDVMLNYVVTPNFLEVK
jgi:hypothetical protein